MLEGAADPVENGFQEDMNMGWRFSKRIRIFKGLTLNLSKSGTSWTVGGKGASINVRGNNVTGSAGIPGTGISYRTRLDDSSQPAEPGKPSNSLGGAVLILILLAILGYVFGR